MSETETKFRTLSRHQYGTLKFINDNHVTLEYLRHAHANTLGSIAYNGWIVKRGAGESAEVVLTKAGEEQLKIYTHASLNERSHEAELTERCRRLIMHSRGRLVAMAS